MTVRQRPSGDIGRSLDYVPWEFYTSTLTGDSFTLGTGGTSIGRYRRRGTEADLRIVVTLGTGGGGAATGTWSVSLPAGWAAEATANHYQYGHLHMDDVGSTGYIGRCQIAPGSSSLVLTAIATGGTYATTVGVNGGAPFTWGNTDFLVAIIRLELQP